jgi:hypothetical protein
MLMSSWLRNTLAFGLVGGIALFAYAAKPVQQATLSANIPGDVTSGADASAIDRFSWESFVAINWPANGNAITHAPDDVALWQSWKADSDVLVAAGKIPIPFNQPSPIPAACTQPAPPGTRILTHDTKMGRLGDFSTPGNGPLIDQNGEYVRFEILLNKTMYDFIVANKLYSTAGQAAYNRGGVVALPSGQLNGAVGAIELKVAWKILGSGDDPLRFHTASAYLYNPASSPTCQLHQVGMVGMHISHKTTTAPQWIWSTFEHVDNAPRAGSVDRNHYSFNDGTVSHRSLGCDGVTCNVPSSLKWDPNNGDKTPSQVARILDFTATAKHENDVFDKLLRAANPQSVFANYRLVGTQFPSDTTSASDPSGVPRPVFLANTTMETYLQGNVPGVSSSCASCHVRANMSDGRPSDFSYLLSRVGGD